MSNKNSQKILTLSGPIRPLRLLTFYTFEDLNPHARGVLFISFKGNVADKCQFIYHNSANQNYRI